MKYIILILILTINILTFVAADTSYQEELARLIPETPQEIISDEPLILNESQIEEQRIIQKEKDSKTNQAIVFWFILGIFVIGSIVFLIGCSIADSR